MDGAKCSETVVKTQIVLATVGHMAMSSDYHVVMSGECHAVLLYCCLALCGLNTGYCIESSIFHYHVGVIMKFLQFLWREFNLPFFISDELWN